MSLLVSGIQHWPIGCYFKYFGNYMLTAQKLRPRTDKNTQSSPFYYIINLVFNFIGGTMMGAKNKVIAGDYEGKMVMSTFGIVSISTSFTQSIELNKTTVEEYEIIDESKRKSATSAVGRAFVGGLVLGPVGWLAGLSAKSKGTHTMAIQFKDGKKSLLEIDDKIYSSLIKKLF